MQIPLLSCFFCATCNLSYHSKVNDLSQNIESQQAPSPSIPSFSTEDLMKSGVYFGHRRGARNPKMTPNIYGSSNDIHIIDVRKTHFAMERALEALYNVAKDGKRILFVSTNPKFFNHVKEVAEKCGQYYVRRWRGGMLTNWRTIISSIKTLKKYNQRLERIENGSDDSSYTKKEILQMKLKREKLERSFGGIVDMGRMPDIVVVFSIHSEKMAIAETRCIGTPVIGIADTNSDPTTVKYPIPGNDDSLRSIELYCKLFSDTIISGTKEWLKKEGLKQEFVIDEKTNTIITNNKKDGSDGKSMIHNQNHESDDQIKMKSKSSRPNSPNKKKGQKEKTVSATEQENVDTASKPGEQDDTNSLVSEASNTDHSTETKGKDETGGVTS
jgi:small subunit ribosomal protein S2